jgi:predicted phosphohydrolase
VELCHEFLKGHHKKVAKKWIQKVINENLELINSRIRTQLDLPGTENIGTGD